MRGKKTRQLLFAEKHGLCLPFYTDCIIVDTPHYVPHTWFAIAVIIFGGCTDTKPTEAPVSNEQEQKLTDLTDADEQRLRDQRAVVEAYLANEKSKRNYQTAVGKLGTIRAILAANVFKPDQTYELQCLGIVLGDTFVQELEMEWIMVEDENGRDPAVRMPGTTIILFPLTMISKRVERGEPIDVFKIFNGVAAKVEDWQSREM